ncbi:MAG: 50S ribosomal protein L32, partial [Paracoccus hibiscisoli]
VPKKKRSLRKRRVRRTNCGINASLPITLCKNCNAVKRTHYACLECGSVR